MHLIGFPGLAERGKILFAVAIEEQFIFENIKNSICLLRMLGKVFRGSGLSTTSSECFCELNESGPNVSSAS